MPARRISAGPIARCPAPIDASGRFTLQALRYAAAAILVALLPLPQVDLALGVPDIRLPESRRALPAPAATKLRCQQIAADFAAARADGRNESASLALARLQSMGCPIPNLANTTRTTP